MKLCVLQPDYSHSTVDYARYDPPRDLAPLVPEWQVDHLFLNKLTSYEQLRQAAGRGYDIFVNLCEGYPEWDIPSVDVIWWLEALDLPYTGPPPYFFNPPKEVVKHVAWVAGVAYPACVETADDAGCDEALAELRFPMFVKPACSGDSLGIDEASYVEDEAALRRKCRAITREFGRAIVEEYVAGREFTVLVAADPARPFEPLVLTPFEFRFPPGVRFKTYKLKVEEHHPEANLPVEEPELAARLRTAAAGVFVRFGGQGYARLDFRAGDQGKLYLLEVNSLCSIFYPAGWEGAADYILRADPIGPGGFLRHIVNEGLARYRRRQLAWRRHFSTPGLLATRDIPAGGVVMEGEQRPHRLVTREYVAASWPPAAVDEFRRWALPLGGGGVYVLWSEDPAGWAPQRHSCDPSTGYRGLDLVALRPIARGAELTLDYGDWCDDFMLPFDCACGAPKCRGRIYGRAGNSIASRRRAPT